MEGVDVLVVGGGSAGLSVSHELTGLGIEHVVLERGKVGQTWRDRWGSFCLVTPNWSVRLPGGAYAGDDPDGFIPLRPSPRCPRRRPASTRTRSRPVTAVATTWTCGRCEPGG